MNASKEQADKSIHALNRLQNSLKKPLSSDDQYDLNSIREFLVAATRKLPHESSYAKDRERRERRKRKQ